MNTSRYQVTIPRPDFYYRKGAHLLRSDRSDYGRCVLTSNWHLNREGFPKDYDFMQAPVRNLTKSTYERIGNDNDGTATGDTTYTTFYTEDVFKKPNKHGAFQPMINNDNFKMVDLDRDLGKPLHGYGSVLPRHPDDKYKMHLKTCYMAHYQPPYPFTMQPIPRDDDIPDHSAAYRISKSQFTEPDGLRPGWNTWHDESALYHNTHLKRQLFVPTDPIPTGYMEDTRPLGRARTESELRGRKRVH